MELIKNYLKRNGEKPLDDLQHNFEELYLCFASLFGIKVNSVVHRKAVYNFIQTHYSPNSESSLQGVFEKSLYWNRKKRGYYELNEKGWDKLNDEYLPTKEIVNVFPIVNFKVIYNDNEITVKSYPDSRQYDIFLNNNKVNALEIYALLNNHGIVFPEIGTSRPREIHSWVLKQNYNWEIINYEEIPNVYRS